MCTFLFCCISSDSPSSSIPRIRVKVHLSPLIAIIFITSSIRYINFIIISVPSKWWENEDKKKIAFTFMTRFIAASSIIHCTFNDSYCAYTRATRSIAIESHVNGEAWTSKHNFHAFTYKSSISGFTVVSLARRPGVPCKDILHRKQFIAL